MNVASLDLCRKLHKLSGWDDCDFSDVYGTLEWHAPVGVRREANDHPRYDLGYLLRKLQTVKTTFDTYPVVLRYSQTTQVWQCLLNGYDKPAWGDTPEDAAAKLAIKLFKAHILSRVGGEAVA